MADFTFKNLRLVNKDKQDNYIDKWYVSYTIDYIDDWPNYKNLIGAEISETAKRYPKIYGSEYSLKLNTFKDLKEKVKKGELLLELVRRDLINGVDPRLKDVTEVAKAKAKLEKSQGVTYDEAYTMMVKHNNWDNPTQAQELTANNNKIYYNAGFRKFVESIGKTDDVLKITSKDIENYILKKNADGDWGIVTSTGKLGNFNYFFTPLVEAGKLKESPVTGIKNLRKKLKKKTKQKAVVNRFAVWTQQEIDSFIEVGSSNPYYLLDYTIGMTCYHAYIRKSEMLRLTLGMVDLDNKKLNIPSNITKSGFRYDYDVIIPLHINSELVEILRTYIETRFDDDLNPDYPLFCTRRDKDKEYDYYQYEKDYRNRLGKALKNGKANYSLKHTGVSKYWKEETEKGVPTGTIISRLMKKCRHKNVVETMRYLTADLGLNIDDDGN